MSRLLRDHPAIRPGLDYLLGHDRVFAASGLTHDDVRATQDHDFTLAGLCETVVGQQLSVKAAATIWGRAHAALDVHDPRAWLAASDEALRGLGLSGQKVTYVRGLALAVLEDRIDFKALRRADDDQVIAALTALKGFGIWSAQMILMFTLARPDIWPAGDLGIQEGLRRYRRLKERPDADSVLRYGRRFAPYRTAAALLLWRLKDRAETRPRTVR